MSPKKSRLAIGVPLVIMLVLSILPFQRVVAAEMSAQIAVREESPLEGPLSEAAREEARIRAQRRTETEIATRPYMAYLLYQNSFRFKEHDRRLAELQSEKRGALGLRDFERSALPTYSGAPLLSLYGPTRFESTSLPWSPTGILLGRLLLAAAVALIVFLPLAAFWRTSAGFRQRAKALPPQGTDKREQERSRKKAA